MLLSNFVFLLKRSSYQFAGTSDPAKCEEEIAFMFPDDRCDYGNNGCSFNNAYLPSIGSTKLYVS
jgi:hypothetical protein